MKKYKNIFIPLASYTLAVFLVYILPNVIWMSHLPPSPNYFGYVSLAVSVFLVLIGIFFGFKGIKSKESLIASQLIVILGGLLLASPLILFVWGYNH